jgi:hypothetical protein
MGNSKQQWAKVYNPTKRRRQAQMACDAMAARRTAAAVVAPCPLMPGVPTMEGRVEAERENSDSDSLDSGVDSD